jgi:hypothetical protein
MLGISGVAEQLLASQGGLSSMEFVSWSVLWSSFNFMQTVLSERLEVLMVVFVKGTVFWDVTCSLVEVYPHFRVTYCLHLKSQRVGQSSSKESTPLAACSAYSLTLK